MSWSRSCPTFLRKTEEYNTRNPENSLQFFPTTDPWTWTSSERSSTGYAAAPSPPPPKLRPATNNSQNSKRPQYNRRQMDTYVPMDTYIPNHGREDEPPRRAVSDWGVPMSGPSKTAQAPPASQRSQGSTQPNDDTNSNRIQPSSQPTNA